MSRSSLITFAVSFVLIIVAGLAVAEPWRGSVEERGESIFVRNPGELAGGGATIALEELWRLDGDDEDSEDFFGVIGHAAFDAEGRVYLLDEQLSEVKIYSADGEFEDVIGREGEGPGEFRRPGGLFFLDDGRLAVLQSRPARIVLLDTDGTPAGDILLPGPDDGGFRSVQSAEYVEGRIALQGTNFVREKGHGERSSRLTLFDPDSGTMTTLDETRRRFDFAKPVIREIDNQYHWSLMPEGRVVLVSDFEYNLRVFSPEGKDERVVSVEYEHLKRDAARRAEREDELNSRVRFRGRRRGLEPEIEVESREPGVRWLDVDGAGNIWVLSGRGALMDDDANLGRFDVFDAQGRLRHRVTLAGDGDLDRDRYLIAGDRLLVLKEYHSARSAMRGSSQEEDEEEQVEEAEPMSIVCYRLPDLDA